VRIGGGYDNDVVVNDATIIRTNRSVRATLEVETVKKSPAQTAARRIACIVAAPDFIPPAEARRS
jgi:hypothetical protein